MASKQENQATEKANVVVRFIKSSYETGMKASEDISLTAWDIPANILEGMGVGEDKAKALKDANRKVIGGVYRGVDAMTRKGTSIVVAPFKGVGRALQKIAGNGPEKSKAAAKAGQPKSPAPKKRKAAARKSAKAVAARKAKAVAKPKRAAKKAAVQAAA